MDEESTFFDFDDLIKKLNENDPSLTEFCIYEYLIKDLVDEERRAAAIMQLCEALKKNTHLQSLYFDGVDIDADKFQYFVEAFKENTTLKELGFPVNKGDCGKYIVQLLQNNLAFKSLDLSNLSFSFEEYQSVLSALTKNENLESIRFNELCELGDQGVLPFVEMLRDNIGLKNIEFIEFPDDFYSANHHQLILVEFKKNTQLLKFEMIDISSSLLCEKWHKFQPIFNYYCARNKLVKEYPEFKAYIINIFSDYDFFENAPSERPVLTLSELATLSAVKHDVNTENLESDDSKKTAKLKVEELEEKLIKIKIRQIELLIADRFILDQHRAIIEPNEEEKMDWILDKLAKLNNIPCKDMALSRILSNLIIKVLINIGLRYTHRQLPKALNAFQQALEFDPENKLALLGSLFCCAMKNCEEKKYDMFLKNIKQIKIMEDKGYKAEVFLNTLRYQLPRICQELIELTKHQFARKEYDDALKNLKLIEEFHSINPHWISSGDISMVLKYSIKISEIYQLQAGLIQSDSFAQKRQHENIEDERVDKKQKTEYVSNDVLADNPAHKRKREEKLEEANSVKQPKYNPGIFGSTNFNADPNDAKTPDSIETVTGENDALPYAHR